MARQREAWVHITTLGSEPVEVRLHSSTAGEIGPLVTETSFGPFDTWADLVRWLKTCFGGLPPSGVR